MSTRNETWRIGPVTDWLMTHGRFLPTDRLVQELGRQLARAGAPVDRLLLSVRMLHPLLVATSSIWTRHDDRLERNAVSPDVLQSDGFLGSPIAHIVEHRKPLRVRLGDPAALTHGALEELAAAGYRDYFGLPLEFSDERGCIMIVAAREPREFSDADLAKFERLSSYLAPVVEVLARRRLASTLLDTYVGHRTGEKVLRGMIRRGDSETIDAALWFSDLRDFTHYTETLPPRQVLDMLNSYFEFVAAAVTARGGEILRFIGDAMLIVFPVGEGTSAGPACRAALESAEDAQASLATLNHRRRRAGEPLIDFGVGLNAGEVVYGNVGAPDRLDFTVMGPAVNRAARLEGLTKTVGEPILMSRRFAEHLGGNVRACGSHAMKGIAEPQEVFAPAQT